MMCGHPATCRPCSTRSATQNSIRSEGLAFSGHLDVDVDRNLTGVSPAAPVESIHEGLKRMNLVGCPSRVVLRTAAVREVGGFDERLSIVADWDLWVRVLAEHEVVRCPELLVGYMSHPGNMHLDAERYLTDLALLRAKHAGAQASTPMPCSATCFRATSLRATAGAVGASAPLAGTRGPSAPEAPGATSGAPSACCWASGSSSSPGYAGVRMSTGRSANGSNLCDRPSAQHDGRNPATGCSPQQQGAVMGRHRRR